MRLSPTESDMSYEARLARFAEVSTVLALLSDERLRELVAEATIFGTGIGGTTALLRLEDISVFVKIIPLTDLEIQAEHVMSTANVFQLPTFCHYGIGSPGSGVWREVAAHAMTTNWVLAKRSDSFPLMYHWRVLSNHERRTPLHEELSDISRMVAFYDGSTAVRNRLEAIQQAANCVMLFCEYVPYHLHDWLTEQIACGEEAANTAFAMVEHSLRSSTAFMTANGLLHFDVHFRNVLTDGRRLYISDFGLVTSARFELSETEKEFFAQNRLHDGCYVVMELVNWLVSALTGAEERKARVDFIRRCADGYEPTTEMMASAAAIIKRYAPIAAVMNEFYGKLVWESRTTPFPVEEIQSVCATTGFDPVLSPKASALSESGI